MFASATGTLDALKSVVYGVGPGVGHGLLILAGYAVIGLLLASVGKPFFPWRQKRRVRRGTRPTTMITARPSDRVTPPGGADGDAVAAVTGATS